MHSAFLEIGHLKLSDSNVKQMHVAQIGCHVFDHWRDSSDI